MEALVSEVITGLATVCRICKGYGTTDCVRMELCAMKLLRVILLVRTTIEEKSLVQFQSSISKVLKIVKIYAETGRITRSIRIDYLSLSLGNARKELEYKLNDLLKQLDKSQVQRTGKIINYIDGEYKSFERVRNMRVRDLAETKLGDSISRNISRLRLCVMEQQELFKTHHQLQNTSSQKLIRQMKSLGIDNLDQQVFNHHIRLVPLEHSPRAIGLQQAHVDTIHQAHIKKYKTIPGIPSRSYGELNDNRREGKDPAFDDFWENDLWRTSDQQMQVLQALSYVCQCDVVDVIQDLQGLEGHPLYFPIKHLLHIKRREKITKNMLYAWVKQKNSPKSVPLAVRQTFQNENTFTSEKEKAEIEQSKWKELSRVICDSLRVHDFDALYNETQGMKIILETLQVSPGDTIVADCTASLMASRIQQCVCTRNTNEALNQLCENIDIPQVQAVCCDGIADIVSSDNYNGAANDIRSQFIQMGGLSVLVSAVFLTDDPSPVGAGAALKAIHFIAKSKQEDIWQALLAHDVVLIAIRAILAFSTTADVPLQHACGILAIFSQLECSAIGNQVVEMCDAMLQCPIKRIFAPAHVNMCQALAHMAMNSEQIALKLSHRKCLVYLEQVVTRVPGDVKVYRVALAAFSGVAHYNADCLVNSIECIMSCIDRFPQDSGVQTYGVMVLASFFRRGHLVAVERHGGLGSIIASLTLSDTDIHWRVYMALREIVYVRSKCTEQTFKLLNKCNAISQVALRLKSTTDERSLTWVYGTLRYLVRACSNSPMVHLDGSKDDDEKDGIQSLINEKIAFQRNRVNARTESESLEEFLDRIQHEEEKLKILDDKIDNLKDTSEESTGLAVAQYEILKQLDQFEMLKFAVQSLPYVDQSCVGSREACAMVFTWFQVHPKSIYQFAPEIIEFASQVIHNCRENNASLLNALKIVHTLGSEINKLLAPQVNRLVYDEDNFMSNQINSKSISSKWTVSTIPKFRTSRVKDNIQAAKMCNSSTDLKQLLEDTKTVVSQVEDLEQKMF